MPKVIPKWWNPRRWKCKYCGFTNYYNKTICYNCAKRRKK